MQKIHVHNDFDVHLNFTNISTDYISRVEFWTRKDEIYCCCKCDGSLKVEDDSNIVCYLNDHNLGTGKLNYNVIFQIPDSNYNDGYKKVCQHYVSDIFLTSENGDTTVAIVKVVGGEEATDLINRLSEFEKVFDNKQDKLQFDNTPTSGSKNVVFSDGIYNAIKNNKPDLTDYAKKTDLQGLATEQWVNDKGYITSIPDDYVTETELNSKGYLTEHQSLADYAKKSDLPSLEGYVTKMWVADNYVSEIEFATREHSISTVEPSVNTEYTLNFSNYLRIIPSDAVKLTFNKSDSTNNLMNDYHILIDCKTAVPTVKFNEVLWDLDNEPVFEKGKIYNISIQDDGTNLYGSWKAYKLISITILITTSDATAVKLNANTYNLVAGDNSLTDVDFKTITDINGFKYNKEITSLDFGGATIKIADLSKIFSNMTYLTEISNINIEDATSLSYMFRECPSLKSLDISKWNVSEVTDFSFMFAGCGALTSLDVSHFDTSKVITFGGMFAGCGALTSLNLSGWNTSSATNFGGMFYGCRSLTSIDLSGFNTSSATNFDSMFSGCSGLTSLDVSHFDTSKVIIFGGMFSDCSGLTSLNLSGWNTSSATKFSNMFAGCTNLKTLDLSGWNISEEADIDDMFGNHRTGMCDSLTTIKMIGCSQETIDKINFVTPASATIITE